MNVGRPYGKHVGLLVDLHREKSKRLSAFRPCRGVPSGVRRGAYGLSKVVLLLWVPPFGGIFALLLADEGQIGVVAELRIFGLLGCCVDCRGGEVSKRSRRDSEQGAGARRTSHGLS